MKLKKKTSQQADSKLINIYFYSAVLGTVLFQYATVLEVVKYVSLAKI